MTDERGDFEAAPKGSRGGSPEESNEALRAQRRVPSERCTVEYSVSPPAEIRKLLNVSQHTFAKLLGVSVRTVQDWEQGLRTPSGPALLRIMDRKPEILLRVG